MQRLVTRLLIFWALFAIFTGRAAAQQPDLGSFNLGTAAVGDRISRTRSIPAVRMLPSNCAANLRIENFYTLSRGGPGVLRVASTSHGVGQVVSRYGNFDVRFSFEPQAPGRTGIRVYIGARCSVNQHPGHSFYFDVDGYGDARQNLIAERPRQESDGGVTYGYRVGDRRWFPEGHYVEVELWYANTAGQRVGNRIAASTLRTAANTHERFKVSKDRLQSPPGSANQLVCIIDRGNVIPETNETDNIAFLPLANLIALAPVQEPNGDVSFGYRTGSTPVNWGGNYVVVSLTYADATGRPLGRVIADHTLLDRPNSHGWFTIPREQIPVPPSGTKYLRTVIDAGQVIPETAEADNTALTELPNLRVTQLRYDSSGRLLCRYQAIGGSIVTNQRVLLQLHYATSASPRDIVSDGLVFEKSIDLNPNLDQQVTLEIGNYPLPPAAATHVIALIDPENSIREQTESDNSASATSQVAPGYRRVSFYRGVGVYRKNTSGRDVYATVADLRRASINHLVDPNARHPAATFWNSALAGNTAIRKLKVLVNGTFFEGEAWNFTPPNVFTFGLKANGTLLDYGARVGEPVWRGYERLFLFDNASAAIAPHSRDMLDDPTYFDAIGGLGGGLRHAEHETIRRNLILARDSVGVGARGETRYRTAIFLSFRRGVTYAQARDEVRLFGQQAWIHLDASSSATMLLDGRTIFQHNVLRPLPHMITIYGGK